MWVVFFFYIFVWHAFDGRPRRRREIKRRREIIQEHGWRTRESELDKEGTRDMKEKHIGRIRGEVDIEEEQWFGERDGNCVFSAWEEYGIMIGIRPMHENLLCMYQIGSNKDRNQL